MPFPNHENYRENISIFLSEKAMKYRKAVLDRYSKFASLYGYYSPDEFNPAEMKQYNCDPELILKATKEEAALVKRINPKLKVVKPLGLYLEPTEHQGKKGYNLVSIAYLDSFWRPWVKQLNEVDVWMVVDGVGTELSNLEHTDKAQAWCAKLCKEYGKEYWTDVENAVMGDKGSYPFSMDRLAKSLNIAVNHASVLVTFDYIHYMSKQSKKVTARALYEAYAQYLAKIKAESKK